MYENWLKGKATPIKFFLHLKKILHCSVEHFTIKYTKKPLKIDCLVDAKGETVTKVYWRT